MRSVAAALSLLSIVPAALAADTRCRLPEQADLPVLEGCRQTAPGTLELSLAALARLPVDAAGLGTVLAAGQFYYVRRDGRHLPVVAFDNGADAFSEGLVRALVDGRLGYYDTALNPAFAARFDWGWPFEDGHARVCDGCRRGTPDADGHVPMLGGHGYRIDRRGQRSPPPR
nr:WG repeat-containing protein [Stenotrophomonas mori]